MAGYKSCKIGVKVVPNSSREEIVGWLGEDLKVRVKCPPENGQANSRLCLVVAQRLGLPEDAVEIMSGFSSARKILVVRGMDREDVVKLLSRTT